MLVSGSSAAEDDLKLILPPACLPSAGITGMCLLLPSLQEAEDSTQRSYIPSLSFDSFLGEEYGGVGSYSVAQAGSKLLI